MRTLNSKEDVYALLFDAPTGSAALGAAIQTGLLWMLAGKPMDADAICQTLNIPGKRGHYWLQYLESFGVLENTSQGYIPTQLICSAILDSRSQGSWQHSVLDESERNACVHGLPQLIREPGSLWTIQGLSEPPGYVDKMRASPERAREFVTLLFEVHQNLAQQVADQLDLTGVERMMDLGGNSGVISMALLRKYPQVTSTIVDIENVCLAGRELIEVEGFADRISYRPADFFEDDFPAGFDLVLQCDVGVYDSRLFGKVYRSLKPGGRLIFVDHFSPAENLAPLSRIEWTFLDSLHDPDFCFPTLDEVRTQLMETGFEISGGLKSAGRGLIVLEARKKHVADGGSDAE